MLYFTHWIFWQESIYTVAKKAGKCCLLSGFFFFWLWTAGNICQLSFLNVFSCVRTVEHVGGGPYKSPCCWIWGIWAQGKWIADSSSKNWRIWGMCFIGLHDLLWYFTYLLHCPSLYIAVVVVFDLIVETIPPYIIVLDSGFAVVFIVQTRCPIFLMRCCLWRKYSSFFSV